MNFSCTNESAGFLKYFLKKKFWKKLHWILIQLCPSSPYFSHFSESSMLNWLLTRRTPVKKVYMRKSFPKDVLKSIPLRFPNFLKQAKSHDSYGIFTCHHTVNMSSYSRIRHPIVLFLEIILGRCISVRIFTKKEQFLKEHFFACFKILYLRILPIKIFSIYLWIPFFFFFFLSTLHVES